MDTVACSGRPFVPDQAQVDKVQRHGIQGNGLDPSRISRVPTASGWARMAMRRALMTRKTGKLARQAVSHRCLALVPTHAVVSCKFGLGRNVHVDEVYGSLKHVRAQRHAVADVAAEFTEQCPSERGRLLLRTRNFAMIWNEMEIVDVRRFQQRDIMAFAEAVEATHHIYERR